MSLRNHEVLFSNEITDIDSWHDRDDVGSVDLADDKHQWFELFWHGEDLELLDRYIDELKRLRKHLRRHRKAAA